MNRRVALAPALLLFSLVSLLSACGDEPPRPVAPSSAAPVTVAVPLPVEPPPTLRLPGDTRPLGEAIELHIDPRQDRFSGVVDVDVELERPRAVLWLHGSRFHVTTATVTHEGGAPLAATWKEEPESGIASLTVASAVAVGKARIHVAFDAPFGRGQKGLYKVSEAGIDYAFTQFEAIAARFAFPCFDEPNYKIPFTTTLVVPGDMEAVANTHEVARTQEGADHKRIVYAPTPPLPSYLVAFAVGPLEIVAAADVPPNGVRTRALPLRGVTTKARGKSIAYALSHTGEILATLEKYFGIEYPYDKLDILAVPGKGGAMENAGAVTFAERLLLMDGATAPVNQRRAYASVMAHELAHQWTGDLVTMQWWDDTWLNEAFATWVGNKAADAWDPKMHAELSFLRSVQGAMGVDSLVSARAVRQPIVTHDDIENAFDSITYQKGGGVLAMFERWAGPDTWQKGLHAYLSAHRFGNATADDFLDAENTATGKDVKSAFHTFLDQAGVPFVEASVQCPLPANAGANTAQTARVHFKQSRFLPLGSAGDPKRTWQIPICVRTNLTGPDHRDEACMLLTNTEGDLELPGAGTCPKWVVPNAGAAGYFRWSLEHPDLVNLRKNGLHSLTPRETTSYANSVRAGYARATTPMKEVFEAVAPLANDPVPSVAEEPMEYVTTARDWLLGDPMRPRVEAYARGLYAPVAAKLGWAARPNEDDERRTLRTSVLNFLVATGRDPAVRAEAKKRGLAYLDLLLIDEGLATRRPIRSEADFSGPRRQLAHVDLDLAGIELAVVGEEADRATWDELKALLVHSVDETLRGRLVSALSIATRPELALAARELVLDPALRDNELMTPLSTQLSRPETREAVWAWIKANYDAVVQRLPEYHGRVGLIGVTRWFCDEAHAQDIEAFFSPRAGAIEGGPRALATTLEDVKLCAARRKVHEPSAREFFGAAR